LKKFILPISPGYVKHWGFWQAVRELIQNAYDQQTLDPACQVKIEYRDGMIFVITSQGKLSRASLVLGNSTKLDTPGMRGQFGEGYKLALLVLARLQHPCSIENGNEIWNSYIEHSDEYESDVLNIDTFEYTGHVTEGVHFCIEQVTREQWDEVYANLGPKCEFSNMILHESKEKGRVYVGGLYVNTLKDYEKGYAFNADAIKLDRDRQMVADFDLAMATSKLWTNDDSDEAIEMLERETTPPDVKYVQYQSVEPSTPIVAKAAKRWDMDYIPVTTQKEIEAATNAGMKWKLVSSVYRSVLGFVKKWLIPTTKSPLERLREFRQQNQYALNPNALAELDNIIAVMDGSGEVTTLKATSGIGF
jgi:hypothetical protein